MIPAAALDATPIGDPAADPAAEVRALGLAAQIAARLVRPIGHFAPGACPLPPLEPDALTALAAHPAFGVPVQRAASRALAPEAAGIDAGLIRRLREAAATRLAALLVVQPLPVLHEAARLLAGAILHRRILALVLKADRERLQAALGPAAFRVATQEAALLHAGLAEAAEPAAQAACLAAGSPDATRGAVVALGLGTLGRFAAAAEPALGRLVALRLGAEPGILTGPPPLGPGACEHVVRLLRRRMDAWSPIIA